MITRGPKSGTLLTVISPGLVAATLTPTNRTDEDLRWYIFDNISFLEKGATLLYIGDESLMVTHWELYEHTDYYEDNEYYKRFLAAVFLHNDKKIYIFYDDHYDMWEPNYYLMIL